MTKSYVPKHTDWIDYLDDPRYSRASTAIIKLNKPELGTGRLYNQINPILKKEFGKGIRKQDFLSFARGVQRHVQLTQPIRRKDSPRVTQEKHPKIRESIGKIRYVRSPLFKYYYYVDIKFKYQVGSKPTQKVIKYMSIFLGAFTPKEFEANRLNRTFNAFIEKSIYEYTGEKNVAYEVLGFWVSKKHKEPVQ